MSELKTIVDEKSYRLFKGADWPSYGNFLSNNYIVPTNIQLELDILN